jgi:hypothetical protein
MKRAAVLCLAAACFLAGQSTAQASPINIDWSYRISATPMFMGTGGGVLYMPGSTGTTNMSTAAFAPTEVGTNFWTLSRATQANPDSLKDAPFALVLHIDDKASGISGAVTFSGVLNGNIWATGSSLQSTLTSSPTQQLWLGHHIYDVSFASFKPPAGNGLGNYGRFAFDVSVHHNPEPSSLVLAGIGAPLFGVVLRRRRQPT